MGKTVKGGGFVIQDIAASQVTTPDRLTEEQRMMAKTMEDFINGRVVSQDHAIEQLDYDLTRSLLGEAGDLGLLSAEVPEAYGGLGLDKISTTLIGEYLAKGSSFALSVGAHVGIGTLPIVYFGSPEQKARYLPDLASGRTIAAYCLTEPSSGSDALGAKTTAVLSDDGQHYILNGTKQFITNAGFADVFIVYAKVDGQHFSTFIVERSMEGLSVGPEEKKMGIKGSSTRPLILDQVKVPASNVLWEVGKGHLIAFNILNIGRFKLAAGCLGGAKEVIEISSRYANERVQFGRPISSFPLIGKKLAEMNILTYALESIVYRTAGHINDELQDLEGDQQESGQLAAKAIAEFAIECSINKVFGSEVLDFVADEGVQIHGGYGYIQEYKIERIYRDSRINRIFEGTNEINRLLIPGTLLKRAMKGELPLLQAAEALQSELMQPIARDFSAGMLAQEQHAVKMAKNIFLMTGGGAVQAFATGLEQQQELLSLLADMMILIYAMESVLLRTMKKADEASASQSTAVAMTRVFIEESLEQIESKAKQACAFVEAGDRLRTTLSILKKLTRREPVNTIALKRHVAQRVIETEGYIV